MDAGRAKRKQTVEAKHSLRFSGHMTPATALGLVERAASMHGAYHSCKYEESALHARFSSYRGSTWLTAAASEDTCQAGVIAEMHLRGSSDADNMEAAVRMDAFAA